jgi:hypothetical protein
MMKKPDFTQVAFKVFQKAVGLEEPQGQEPLSPKAAAGRKGGLKGGVARSKALSQKRRREIARKAAEIRWRRKKPKR